MIKAKDADAAEHLRRMAVDAIVRETGLNEEHALPFANAMIRALQRCFGGDRVFIPKGAANDEVYDARRDGIRRELESGAPSADVCRRYRIHRTTLHRMFPGGLPRPKSA